MKVIAQEFKDLQLIQLLLPVEVGKGTGLCNPSVLICENGEILVNIRHVNYCIYQNKKYRSRYGTLTYLHKESKPELRTENYIISLDKNLKYKNYKKINTLMFDTAPKWEFIGLEDGRLVEWDRKLYITGVRRDVKPNGEGRMELCELEEQENEYTEVSRLRIEPPTPTYCEKNWMPILDQPYTYLRWPIPTEVIKLSDIKNQTYISLLRNDLPVKFEREQRGGSQVIKVGDKYLCITHELELFFDPKIVKNGIYTHRVVIWNEDWIVERISKSFSFLGGDIEFCTGLALYNSFFLITFGYQDNSAFLLKLPLQFINELEYEYTR